MKKKVAIFDVDGTIFRSSLVIELTEVLIDRDIFPKSAEKEYERQYRKWVEREGDYEAYINSLVVAFMKNIKGVHYGDFSDLAKEVVNEQKKRVYRYTRDLVKDLKKKNFFLLAISQSPKTIVDGFCRNLGFDKVYGRVYEIGPQNRFTGKIIDQHLIENKANIVRRAIEREGLSLKGSVGVGDTEGDVSFLEMVDNPICFNPNQKLYKHANRMDWRVVVERKDVVYEI